MKPRGRRVQHVYFVQENDEVEIHFTNEAWPINTMHLACTDGLVTMTMAGKDQRWTVDLVRLHEPPDAQPL